MSGRDLENVMTHNFLGIQSLCLQHGENQRVNSLILHLPRNLEDSTTGLNAFDALHDASDIFFNQSGPRSQSQTDFFR